MSRLIRTIEDLDRISKEGLKKLYPEKLKILIGSASCGIAAGAAAVEDEALKAVEELDITADVGRTGCIGFCIKEPIVDLIIPEGPRISFGNMTAKKIRLLLESYSLKDELKLNYAICSIKEEEHLAKDESRPYPASDKWSEGIEGFKDLNFYGRQKRVILRNCGSIDPFSIEEALARGAYRGAYSAINKMTRDEVISNILESGLRGRGGAGFPTGKKLQIAAKAVSKVKYVICNADEGDPGAFMDRSVLEGDPHAVIEGMMINAYAIGASEGIVYVRSEYPLAVTTINHAIEDAKKAGLLGDNIFGSGFDFTIRVRKGSGAFVCGEETALIASIEGKSGEPETRPPYPAIKGLFGKPTVINNVKTLASLGPILSLGPKWYAKMGAPGNRGTTVFSLVGAVKNTGLVEVPLGITLREMIYDIGGGESGKQKVKAIQTGGPSGGCIPASMLDMPLDYEKLAQAGSMMGSGGMIVLDESTCMVDLAKFFITFTSEESCGKCSPCREGSKQMLRLLNKICDGVGERSDLDLLERLSRTVKTSSLCGLGATAPNPVLSAINYFRDEFEAHIVDKVCPAGVCKNLITFKIIEEECTGCAQCVSVCAVNAISGEAKAPHEIDPEICNRCGACRSVCPAEAVIGE